MSSIRTEQEQLNDILSKQEYQVYYEDNRSFLERIWDRVTNWIGDILTKLFDSFEPSSTAGNLIIVLIVLIVSAVVIFGVIALIMFTARKRRLSNQQPFNKNNELDWNYDDHLQSARDYEIQADYRLATRHQFLALLLIFHEYRLLQANQWKTNWDYYEELKQTNKPLAVDFYNLALFFEKVTYGEQSITEEDYQTYKTQINRWIDSILHQSDTKEIGER
ncbi:hypothetical protein SAMN04487943_105223 [Gracilibacillus orientalis]|uniref:Protein-glutamine gamma-glutamyltransferase-like C-terminal domain-containing protein n=1 Tax=Gracilibacillus orientalis TaxID=334253 RepID=A0A1I4LUP9_9BACI|nr:DUF4129 domain-containing protein [Gracilibacillus orientalis]SFL94798.1 hypothetical protein SAMN04487943_105223 [Gracilibacillus orientalis]